METLKSNLNVDDDLEESEDSASSGDEESFGVTMRPILPVADFVDYDPSVPPQSGADYLRRVQLEAKREPAIMVAANWTQLIGSSAKNFEENENQDEMEKDDQDDEDQADRFICAKSEYRLSPESISAILDKFGLLHQKLDRRRGLSQSENKIIEPKSLLEWFRKSVQRKTTRDMNTDNTSKSHEIGNLSRIAFVSRLSQSDICLLLRYHLKWIENDEKDEKEEQEQEPRFTTEFGLSIYALLAALDRTQIGDVYSLLRQISRRCSQIRHRLISECDRRATINEEEKNQQAENEPLIQRISSLQMIITIIGHFFGQKDLLDS